MDRSQNKRLVITYCLSWPLAFCLLLMFSSVVVAVEEKESISYSGVFYGYLIDVQPDFSAVTVKPIEKGLKRRRFYLDKRSKVYVDLKRKPKSDLYLDDKVAVRYFGQDHILVADAIYVVFGKFEEKDYILKKKLVVIKVDESAKKEEKGGH